jgi:hypothetical protein
LESEKNTVLPVGPRQQYVVLLIVSFGMMTGVAIFAGVAIALTRSAAFPPLTGSTAQAIQYSALGVVFVGLVLASVQGSRRRQLGQAAGQVDALRIYARSVIVPQALREFLGILGIVAGLLTGSESWIIIFAAGSITSQFMGRPRMADLEATVRSAETLSG